MSATVKPISEQKLPAEITQEQYNEVMFPELSKDSFQVGEQKFAIQILPHKWDIIFRQHALPLLKAQFKPIEQAIYNYQTERHMTDKDLHITESLIESQQEVDEYVLPALVTICVSQDPLVLEKAAANEALVATDLSALRLKYEIMLGNAKKVGEDGTAIAAAYYKKVVDVQVEKQKMVQALGEDLLARLETFVGLAGVSKMDISSLRVLFLQQLRSALEKAGRVASTWAKSLSPDMVHSSAISTHERMSLLARIRDEAGVELEKLQADEEKKKEQSEQPPKPQEEEQKEKETLVVN